MKKDARNARASAVEKEIELDDGELWERVLDPTGSSDEESEEEEAAGEEGEAGAVEAAAGEAVSEHVDIVQLRSTSMRLGKFYFTWYCVPKKSLTPELEHR